MIDTIVRFNSNVVSQAGLFCYKRGITGKIVGQNNECYILDFGMPYQLHASRGQLDVVAVVADMPIYFGGDI